MSEGSAKKIKLNFLFGILGQAITLIIGIIVPRLFIINFGSETNGFVNGINQIYVYVALLEAGVGTASLRALFAPAGSGDRAKMNGILAATNKYYIRTAWIYSGIIVLLAFIYPLFFLSSSIGYWMMFGIVIITGGSGAVAYFCHAKYRIFLSADGKEYVTTIISIAAQIGLSVGKVVALLLGANVLVVQGAYLAANILQALAFKIYITKKYGWIDLSVQPDDESISQKNSVLVHQISTLIFNNTDVLLLSFACDLRAASIYALYKNFINIIGMVISNFSNSVNFKLGQTFENRERFIKLHDCYECIHVTTTFSLCSVALMLFAPFIKLYTSGMDADYNLTYMPLLIVLVEVLSIARIPTQNVITYAGHFKQTTPNTIIESAINLVCSVALVLFLGIYGVLLGTVIALFYRVNDIIIYTNKKILNRSVWSTYKIWLVNLIFSTVAVVAFQLIPYTPDSYLEIIVCAAIICVTVVPLQFVFSLAFSPAARSYAIGLIKRKNKS